jgi:hypothetical protein
MRERMEIKDNKTKPNYCPYVWVECVVEIKCRFCFSSDWDEDYKLCPEYVRRTHEVDL